MNTELRYLALVSVLTGLLWVPYILNEIMVRGLLDAVGYPENPRPLARWAQRLKAAHYNAVENLVVFAALVLVAGVAGIHDPAIATAAAVYFWARVVHAAAYTLAVPWVRTLSFVVGFAMQIWIAWTLLAH
ncbi:MAG TPA: MAPEG family protein [Steroidobacteraceae bacterium]|nr:MAPEG family protein [Steroidobacteraceae bacterium]